MAIAKHKSRRSELREGRELARRVQRGDRWAFQVLYASYEGALFRFGHRLTGSSEAAAALVDATFARALATLPEDGLDSVDVGAHLFATARSLSYGRNGDGNGSAHANGGNGNGHANGTARYAVAGEHAREVVAANARLAPRQRMTLALRDLEGRPDEEIALALGAESPSVPALVARARLRLREELALPAATAGCATHLADLSAYTDRTLPADRRAGLEAHLEGCADCRAALFALREAAERYRAVPVPVPPGELSARMAAALDAAGLLERRAAPVAGPAPAAARSGAPSPRPRPHRLPPRRRLPSRIRSRSRSLRPLRPRRPRPYPHPLPPRLRLLSRMPLPRRRRLRLRGSGRRPGSRPRSLRAADPEAQLSACSCSRRRARGRCRTRGRGAADGRGSARRRCRDGCRECGRGSAVAVEAPVVVERGAAPPPRRSVRSTRRRSGAGRPADRGGGRHGARSCCSASSSRS